MTEIEKTILFHVPKTIYLFGCFMDGIITEGELISQLSELPEEITNLLPNEFQSSHPYRSLKLKINKLRNMRKAGKSFTIKSSC